MPRRHQPLVTQFIENLSSQALERYADIIRDIVGRRHGVYALYRRDKLYYVGLATNLRSRLRGHLKDRHRGLWDRFSVYLTIDHRHLRELELLAIRIAQPKGNKHKGKFAKAESLTRTLRRRLRAQQRAEWHELIGRQRDTRGTAEVAVRGRAGGRSLADRFDRAVALRAKYKGKVYKARLRRNGTIRCGGRAFDSPSLAAAAVVGRAANGWRFWTFERSPGQWVRLAELRRR